MCFSSGALAVATGFPLLRHRIIVHDLHILEWSTWPMLWRWCSIIAILVFTTTHSQDMYDQAGDGARGRRTVPLVIGDFPARCTIAVAVTFWSLVTPLYWGLGIWVHLVVGAMGFIVCARTLIHREVAQDKRTFLIWNGWLICIYLLPLVKAQAL
jgi:4-hydroxybenzoate polyprenyltransferase